MTQGPYPIEILTTSQMARADSLAIAGGVPSMTLMENAAAAITRTTNQILQKSSGRRVLVLCGPGNNGGDGYVAARLLRNSRIKVKVAALTPRESLRGDALAAATAWDGAVEPAETCSFDGTDLVVDALFGSGLARDIDGPAAELVARLNKWRRESGQNVVAVDMPSGIDGTTGAVRGVAVEADATVTFFRLKSGHLLLPGRLHCGDIDLRPYRDPLRRARQDRARYFRQRPRLLAGGAALSQNRGAQIFARACPRGLRAARRSPARRGWRRRRRRGRGPGSSLSQVHGTRWR